MMPFYVVRAINRYCRVLNIRGVGCGECQIMDLCNQDIEEHNKWKKENNGAKTW